MVVIIREHYADTDEPKVLQSYMIFACYILQRVLFNKNIANL